MSPQQQTARDFLANAAKRNHGLEWHKNPATGKTVIDKACPAVTHDGEQATGLDESKCTCGARRHNALVERALNILVVKEKNTKYHESNR